jgi:hypothetical protein
MVLELRRQRAVRRVVLGRDDEPGGVLVDAVDDAGPDLPVDAREAPPQWCSSAFTSVPSGWPAAGWTTSPFGLLTTITSPSS